jgi:ABC transporter substrate binding protein
LGWAVGRNLRIDYRWGGGDADGFRRYATELVALAPDVILAASGATIPWLLQATRSVPIVFTQTPDPVGAGFAASLAHPGGNITGFTSFECSLGGNTLGVLKEIAPGMTRVAVLRDTVDSGGDRVPSPDDRYFILVLPHARDAEVGVAVASVSPIVRRNRFSRSTQEPAQSSGPIAVT